jgi:hypothetical protein
VYTFQLVQLVLTIQIAQGIDKSLPPIVCMLRVEEYNPSPEHFGMRILPLDYVVNEAKTSGCPLGAIWHISYFFCCLLVYFHTLHGDDLAR